MNSKYAPKTVVVPQSNVFEKAYCNISCTNATLNGEPTGMSSNAISLFKNTLVMLPLCVSLSLSFDSF